MKFGIQAYFNTTQTTTTKVLTSTTFSSSRSHPDLKQVVDPGNQVPRKYLVSNKILRKINTYFIENQCSCKNHVLILIIFNL
jgi:hypothetical protein